MSSANENEQADKINRKEIVIKVVLIAGLRE
jgi:hypothetical protein